jgi:acetyl esterase/lipase
MAQLPAPIPAITLPALRQANALRRRVEGRIRSVDTIRWDSVPYGEHPAQVMRIWELNNLCPRDGWPAVLLIHGGGWMTGSRHDFESLGPALGHRGLMAAAMDYRLAPEHRWPAQLEDVFAAIEFLRDQQVDRSRIALWGHSAGGQMALMAGLLRPDLVRCVVAMGAPSDLRRIQDTSPDPLEDIFDAAHLDAASPIRVSCDSPPPILLVHGEKDPVCPVEHAREHAAARPEHVQLIEVPGGDHGLRWPLLGCLRARRQAIRWLVTQTEMPSRGSKWRRSKKGKGKGRH